MISISVFVSEKINTNKACTWKIPLSSLTYADLSPCSLCTAFVSGRLMEHDHFKDKGKMGE
jgi:hypothetical protein